MWPDAGEVWSTHWGSSEIQWAAMILPRIFACLPARSIVEIGPGYGRWTRFLLALCETYAGFDVSPLCTEHCRKRFADTIAHRPVRFETNDGTSLPGVPDASVDFVFSFDCLVHVEQATLDAYLAAITRALRPGGRAFLHHSNYAAVSAEAGGWDHERGRSQSAEAMRAAAGSHGLHVLVQEPVSWAHHAMIDCFTSVAKPGSAPLPPTLVAENPGFWADNAALAGRLAPYHRKG